ncbi:hypothetical protein [Mucilaginibacter sp.]
MNYNVYFKGSFPVTSLFDISEEKLNILITAYKQGLPSVTLAGIEYGFNDVTEFRIFMNESGWDTNKINEVSVSRMLFSKSFGGAYVKPEKLTTFGVEVTEQQIGNLSYGYEKTKLVNLKESVFVNLERLNELKAIDHPNYDLSKLIRLCEEINSNWRSSNYYSVGLLIRTVINHIPPIFGFKTFEQVVGGYGSKSFKKSMSILNESLRSIADNFTHSVTRKKDPLPNDTQVDFRNDFDLLLSELIANSL